MKFNNVYKSTSFCFCIAVFLYPDELFIHKAFVPYLLLPGSSQSQMRKVLALIKKKKRVSPQHVCSSGAWILHVLLGFNQNWLEVPLMLCHTAARGFMVGGQWEEHLLLPGVNTTCPMLSGISTSLCCPNSCHLSWFLWDLCVKWSCVCLVACLNGGSKIFLKPVVSRASSHCLWEWQGLCYCWPSLAFCSRSWLWLLGPQHKHSVMSPISARLFASHSKAPRDGSALALCCRQRAKPLPKGKSVHFTHRHCLGTPCPQHCCFRVKWKPKTVLALKAGSESAPGRACWAPLFCWGTGREEERVCRGKLRRALNIFLVLPSHPGYREGAPCPQHCFFQGCLSNIQTTSSQLMFWKIVCSPLLKGLCAPFFACLQPLNDDLSCSFLLCRFLTDIFNCSLSLWVSLLLLVLTDFTLQSL